MITKKDINTLIFLFNKLHENSSGSNNAGEMWVREEDIDILSDCISALWSKAV